MSSVHVLKFGGTSLKDASFINQAVDIIASQKGKAYPVVVVSALGGVTDQLVKLASTTDEKATEIVDKLRQFHADLFDELIQEPDETYNGLLPLFEELQTVANDTTRRTESYDSWRDHLLSFGERASVRLIEAALNARGLSATKQEAQHFIKTDASFGEATVLTEETRKSIRQAIPLSGSIPVITGFIGATEDGRITTLGRSGSDYTASLIADALDADHLEIWTDVNGVLTADPEIVPSAQSIDMLNFEDIAELATHGVGVIHSKTIQPIRNRNISLQVRNSHNLDHPGTHIHKAMPSNGNFRSVTVKGPFVYLRVSDQYANALNMLTEEQTNKQDAEAEAFSYLRHSKNEPAQFLFSHALYDSVKTTIHKWASDNDITLDIQPDIYKVKKFTNELRQDDASLSKLLDALREKGIRPISVNRNHDQRHITLLLPKDEASEAARAINNYWLDDRKTIPIFVAGTGAVGGTLINLLQNLKHPKYTFQILGQCDSQKTDWNGNHQTTSWPAILKELQNHPSSNIIFVDATGSEEVAQLYPKLFAAGIHIVTPSKLANTFDQAFYNHLRKVADKNKTAFRYETTVGAGLPVISTLDDLLSSGDEITEISGVASGTMTYLFDQLEQDTPFSEAIVEARNKGYAEPDPRDDLSGEDVARKFLTLAREIGWQIERDDLQVQSLIPEELAAVDAETFLERLPEFDDYWTNKLEKAQSSGKTLRYTGQLANGNITIGVQEISRQSPLGQLRGTDNLIRIASNRYNETPIIIQGPGAGKKVTAAGVLADIIKSAALNS